MAAGCSLVCVCRNAGVQCAGHWLEPHRHVSRQVADRRTGVEYLRTSVNVTHEDVDVLPMMLPAAAAAAGESPDEVGDDVTGTGEQSACECHAWNSVPALQTARGRKATLRLAC